MFTITLVSARRPRFDAQRSRIQSRRNAKIYGSKVAIELNTERQNRIFVGGACGKMSQFAIRLEAAGPPSSTPVLL